MSDTPETDDQPIIYAINDNGYQVPCVDLEFSRRLERERDEARELLANALVRGDMALEDAKKAKDDLHWSDIQDIREMQRERDKWEETARLYCQNSDYHQEMREKAERERNSARAKFVAAIDGRDMANEEADKLREQNAKLRDIAEWFANQYFENDGDERWPSCPVTKKAQRLRAELDQLKEEAK